MAKQIKYFPSQANEEKVFLLVRKHWFNYIIFLLLDILGLIPIIFFVSYWIADPTLIQTDLGATSFLILSVFTLVILGAQLYGFVDNYLDIYIVTDQRIVDISQEGFFKRQISELHLHQVQDVNASVVGLWGTILHFGDIHIQTAGERENFVFRSVPHSYTVAKQIITLHEAHMEKDIKLTALQVEPRLLKVNAEDKGLPYEEAEFAKHSPESASENKNPMTKAEKVPIPPKPLPKIVIKRSIATKKLISVSENTSKKNGTAIESGELHEGQELNL